MAKPKKRKSISVQARKSKGRRLQKWVAQKISEITGFEHGKDKPIESRPMGQSGVDVRLEQKVLDVFKFSVECKSQESWNVHKWIEQAKENELPDTDWLLIAKRNQKKPVAIMDAFNFFRLLGELITLKNKPRRTK